MRNKRSSRGGFRGLALLLAPLLFLLPAPAWPCTTNVNTGFQGQTILGNFIMEFLPTGSTVSVSPAAGVGFVNQRNPSGTRVFFDVVIDANATPGGRTVICTFPNGATVTTPNGFTVLAQPTPTPTVTPTAPPPTPTPTPTATPPGATPTATPPGATPTPTPTPGPPPSGSLEVAPDSIAGGGRRARIVIAGSGFDASTRVLPPADVSIEGQRIISATRLEILISTAPGVPAGPRLFSVFNGPIPLGTVIVTVVPPVSLGAPLSVMTAAIVFPRPGSILAPDEELFARALLAVTGTGVVIGAWEIDGAPFERFEAYASGGEPVTLESKVPVPIHAEGDHFLRLAIEHPQFAVTEMVRIVRLSAHAARLRLGAPPDGAEARRRPRFRWTLVPGAQAYEIVFSRDPRELPESPVFRSVRAFWTPAPEDWRALGEGTWFWAVRPILPVDVRGALSRWRRIVLPPPRDALGPPPRGSPKALGFLLAALQQKTPRVPETEEEIEEEEEGAAVADWKLDVTGSATVNSGSDPGEEDVAHLALSSASSFLADTWSLEETVDFAGHHQVDPQTTTQDSRSWVIGAEAGGRWSAAGMVGYSPPTIGEGTQLLNPGLARGGAEVRLGTPFGKFSGYGTFDDDLEAIFSSTYGSEQRLRLAAYDAPLPGPKLLLRGVYLEAEEQPDDFFGLASSAKAYGGLFRWTASPAFSISLEAASSKSEDEGEEDFRGEAIRLSLQGKKGRTAYSLNLHDTDAEFANPANRGLTSAGQPDRIGGDVGLSHAFGRIWLGVSFRHLEAKAAGAESRSDAGQLTLTAPLGKRVQINASGLWTGDRGDGSPSGIGPFPRLDRIQYGGRLTLTETLGLLQLSQNLGWTRFDDRVSRVNDVETQNASLAVNGGLHRNFMLAVSAAFTRSERALTGDNDNLVLHFQPRWTIPVLRLSFLPRATYSRSESDASRFASQGEQYQVLLEWRPFRPGEFEAVLGASGDWSRSRFGPADPGFTRRYIGTLSIRWGVGASFGEPAPTPASVDSLTPTAPLSSRIASMAPARYPDAMTSGRRF